jgi:hypothetical protein
MNVRNPQSPHGAVSVGVSGVAPVLNLLDAEEVAAVEGPGDVFYFEAGGEDCAVGPAIEGSPARVVCSEKRESLDLLLPYALRGMPREKLSGSDMHAEFRMAPLRATYGKELKTYLRWAPAAARSQHVGQATFDRALSDGATALAREGSALIDELEGFTVHVNQSSGDFRARFEVELKGERSDTVRIMKELASRQKGVPALFDEIPSTASTAGYSRELSPELTGPWVSIVADLLKGGAELEGANKQFARRLGKLVERLAPQGKDGAYARGPLVESVVDGEKKLHPAWVLSGTTRSKADIIKILDDVSWLLASKDAKKLAQQVPEFPRVTRRRTKIKGAPGAAVYEWSLPKELMMVARLLGAQMGPGADADNLVNTIESFSKGYIGVHEVRGMTWISWGQKKGELAESFQAISNKDSEKLASLGDLGGVRSEPSSSAGYSKLEGIVGMASSFFPPGILSDWSGIKAAMPGHGTTPVLYFFQVKEGASTKASWEVRVPAKFTQDLAALAVMMAASQQKSLSESTAPAK